MIRLSALFLTLTLALCATGDVAGQNKENPKVDNRVFEMRIYYAHPGKMKALHDRFANHTIKLFEKHGMKLVGFWVPRDAKAAEEKLVYILSYPSKEAADKSWAGFRADADWLKAKEASEKDGPIVAKVESMYLDPVSYSPIK